MEVQMSEESTTTTSTILLMAKIGAMIGLGCGSLALGMLPLIVGRCRARAHCTKRRRGISSNSGSSTISTSTSTASSALVESGTSDSQGLLTSLLLCFGGGVLLFTTFLHLAPEVRLSVERHQSNGQLPTFGSLSLSELLFCGGFFLVYLVEEAVHAALTGKPESSEALLYRTVSVRRCNNNQSAPSQSMTTTGSTTTVSTATRSTLWKDDNDLDKFEDSSDFYKPAEKKAHHHHHHQVDIRHQDSKDEKVLPAIFVLSAPSDYKNIQQNGKDSELPQVTDCHYPPATILKNSQNNHHHHHHHHHRHDNPNMDCSTKKQDTSVQGLLTVLALSFHAIFEGLAVGLEPSIGSVVYLAAAIATHKLVISFCVGMELFVAGASTRTTLGYMSVFSMVTPIGIAVGLALGHFKNDSENLGPTPTILQGMAAGTLLYVVFFEVLARERANEKSGLLQLLAILIGFMLMLGLQITTAHSHSHGGHGGHEHEKHDHDHEDHTHHHRANENLFENAIEKVTESIAQVVSQTLSSTANMTHSNGSSTVHTSHPHSATT